MTWPTLGTPGDEQNGPFPGLEEESGPPMPLWAECGLCGGLRDSYILDGGETTYICPRCDQQPWFMLRTNDINRLAED